MSPGTGPNFGAIPFDVPSLKGRWASVPQTYGLGDPDQNQQAAPQRAATQDPIQDPGQIVRDQDTTSPDQAQTGVPARESAQPRTAKQRLEFFSPPDKPVLMGNSHEDDAADDALNTPSSSAPAVTGHSQGTAAAFAAPHSPAPAPDRDTSISGQPDGAAQGHHEEVLEQRAHPAEEEMGSSPIAVSRYGTTAQLRLDTWGQEVADLTGTQHTPTLQGGVAGRTNGAEARIEARMQASGGPFSEQHMQQPVAPKEDGHLSSQTDPPQSDQHSSAVPTYPTKAAGAGAVSAGALQEPPPKGVGLPDSSATADSLLTAATAETSGEALLEHNSPIEVALHALSATGEVSDGKSEDGHKREAAGRKEPEGVKGAAIMQAASRADTEPEEVSAVAQHGSSTGQQRDGASGAEATQKSEHSIGSAPPAEHAAGQQVVSQASEGAGGPDDGQGAGHSEKAALLCALPVEGPDGSNGVSETGSSGPAHIPVVVEEQQQHQLLEAVPQDQEAGFSTEEAGEEPPVTAILPGAQPAPAVAAEVLMTAPMTTLADRPAVSARLPSLPVPPPVTLFQRQPFTPHSKLSTSAPTHAAVSSSSVEEPAVSATLEQHPRDEAISRVPPEAEADIGDEAAARESTVTDADLLALAEEVRRLEEELVRAQTLAESAARQADAARADTKSAHAEAAEWREREADARAELAAIREAYTEVRADAEAVRQELGQLQEAHKALHEQMTTSLQEAHAVEGVKMRMRLERAERAIEQERATVRDLQRALAATRQVSPAASPRKDDGQLRAALAAAQKELADTRAALEAQKLTNSGLQIRVTELLRTAEEAEQLRRNCEELRVRSEAVLRSEDHTKQLEAAVETLRAQNNSLHVTMERLLGTNSELGTKVNSQAAQISSLEALLADARAKGPAPAAPAEPAGGVRFSESDLELLALAEYVKELEAALERQRTLSATQQQSTPAKPAPGPGNTREDDGNSGSSAAEVSHSNGAVSFESQGGPQSTEVPVEEGQHAEGKGWQALESPAPPRKQSVSWWGYITGADRATPVKGSR